MDNQTKIIAQVFQERKMQDRQWGGGDHDDTHTDGDWMSFIDYQMSKEGDLRTRLIKVAALAVAAVESMDRKNGHN